LPLAAAGRKFNFFRIATRRGANLIPNFKEIENWENEELKGTNRRIGLQKMASFLLTPILRFELAPRRGERQLLPLAAAIIAIHRNLNSPQRIEE